MMHDIIKMCSFESTKSTKGASKMRRDLLNAEISQLRDLLPLPPSTRQRLSQLQLMALVCVYVRKSNYFQQAMKNLTSIGSTESPNLEFLKALSGFLMMLTQGGKLLYISDNAAEYLGHSMEDLLIHGDSVFDIIDKQDHAAVQSELVRGSQPTIPTEEERLFLCRMNVSRNARRQMRFGDQKVVLVQGHYLSYLPLCSRNEPVFLAHCTPVAMPETRECVVQGATNVFTSVHTLDMKFISIDRNGEYYLGYEPSYLTGASWYHLIHPDNLREAQTKHRLITSSEQDRSCILLLRLQSANGSWRWVHCVLQVKDSGEVAQPTPAQTPTPTTTTPPALSQQPQQQQQPQAQPQQQQTPVGQQPVIVATNQVLNDKEAAVLRANAWLYHFYAMQSKLQYGIAYDAHAQRVNAYYPQVMPYQVDPSTSYMTPPSLPTGHYPQSYPSHPGATTAYPIGAGNPYLQHYTHPYSVRIHHGFDYSRDSSWGYYDAQTSVVRDPQASHNNLTHNQSHSMIQTPNNTPQQSPQQVQRPSKKGLSSSPQRKSPLSTGHGTPESMCGLATPMAVKATVTTHHKGLSPSLTDDGDSGSWKHASPTQEVPDYPDYSPYLSSPYNTTTATKVSVFAFEADTRDAHHTLQDQHVPSGHHAPNARDGPWYAHAFVR